MTKHQAEQRRRVFHCLADPTRLRLVERLRAYHKPQAVSQLVRAMKLPQPTVSHHLGLLRIHHLVEAKRVGKQKFYSLRRQEFWQAAQWLTGVGNLVGRPTAR